MAIKFTKKLPKSKSVELGKEIVLEIEFTAADPHTTRWTLGGKPLADFDNKPRLAIPQATASDFGEYVVTVADAESNDDSTCTVTEKTKEEKQSPFWSNRFAAISAAALVVVFIALAYPATRLIRRLYGDGNTPSFSAIVALELLVIGVFLVCIGAYLALLELRGRAQAATEIAGKGLGEEAAKAVPEALKAFAGLSAPSAALVIAAVAFICATFLGWRNLPNPNPAPAPSATTVVTPTALPTS